ncbi:MAG: class II aldolase/adducin family protein [Candidatus Sabulitectum sp.]|nr:class II aldolase/adducin family protein [Candidatus Sabulitectum sp.]
MTGLETETVFNHIALMEKIDLVRKDISEIASHLARMGWSEANAGNISVLMPRGTEFEIGENPNSYHFPEPVRSLAGRTLLITATGSRFRRIKRDTETQIVPVTVTEFGTAALWPSHFPSPTSEIGTHIQVHSLTPDIGWETSAIVHTHSTKMLTLSSSDMPGEMLQDAVERAHPEISILMRKGLAFLDFTPPGTWELGKKTRDEFKQANAVIWRKHGILGFAEDIEMACDYVEMTEKAAEILLLEKSAFGNFLGLKDKELENLREELGLD